MFGDGTTDWAIGMMVGHTLSGGGSSDGGDGAPISKKLAALFVALSIVVVVGGVGALQYSVEQKQAQGLLFDFKEAQAEIAKGNDCETRLSSLRRDVAEPHFFNLSKVSEQDIKNLDRASALVCARREIKEAAFRAQNDLSADDDIQKAGYYITRAGGKDAVKKELDLDALALATRANALKNARDKGILAKLADCPCAAN